MKKSAKQKIVVVFILAIFGMSSIAFVFLSITGQVNSVPQETIESPVLDREVSPNIESVYIQNGVTFLKYYYTEKDDIYDYVGTLPNTLTTLDGGVQLVVERIQSDSRRMEIQSLYDSGEVESMTSQDIFGALCSHLVSTPPECLFASINSTL